MLGLWDVSMMAITFVLENLYHVIHVIMSTVYFYLTFLLVPIVVPLGDFLWQGVQRCFFPYDYQIVQEIHSSQLTVEPERSFAFPLLPRKTSKYSGLAFDSPGYESFFASQQGVYAPQKAWDVIRRASERTKPKTLPKK